MFDSIFVVGCSFPYGEELPEETRNQTNFPGLIGKYFSVPVHNLSKPGGSNDRIVRLVFSELPKLAKKGKPLVIIPWTQIHRREKWDTIKNDYVSIDNPFGPTTITVSDFDHSYFAYHSSSDDDILKTLIAKVSVQQLVKNLELPYLFVEMFDNIPNAPIKYKSLENLIDQRFFLKGHLGEQYKGCVMGERGHPLEDGHKKMADYLICQIKNVFAV